MTPQAGKQFGHYVIHSQIGAGGMGEVFLAEDTRLRRPVALKFLSAQYTADADRLARFNREAQAASALNHPNILTVYEIGAENEIYFIAAEFIDGEMLRDKLQNDKLTIEDALDIAAQTASALSIANEAGIVHRDIKPENIMIRRDGLVKVLDFGLAKLIETNNPEAETKALVKTKAGMIMGTAAYMSPEQARGKETDGRTDIWSFGCVLYEMLTGKQPFRGETMTDVLANIIHREPSSLLTLRRDAPAELVRIVNKSLCKNKDERYKAAKDLLADLKSLQKRLLVEAELESASSSNKLAEAQTQIIKAKTTANTETQNSIAVLPFSNLSNDVDNEYFCDGLAEELLNALSKIEDLKVAARTSAFSFKNKNVEISEIGTALNVKTILEGSVRKSGSKLRITVQLINAADGYHLWSERYDREMRDIFDVQDEITLAVVDVLKLKLFGEEKAAVLKRYTDNTEAYELYLKGRYCFNKYAPEYVLKGIEYFERAIEIEPEYAPAYAGIGFCYGLLTYFGSVAPHEIVPKWGALINKALEIDASLADAHLSLASIHFYYEWNSAEAERDYRRAIELNPNSPDAHWRYGHFLAARERFEEAVGEGEKAVELDPLSLVVRLFMVRIYGLASRVDDSIEQARKMIEIEPNFSSAYLVTGGAYMQKGLHEEAVEAYRKTLALSGFVSPALSVLGAAYGVMGKRDEAYSLLNQLLEMRKSQYVAAFAVARVYAGLGENDKAFEWLEKSLEERNGEMVFLKSETQADLFAGSLHADARYQDILRRIDLPIDKTAQCKTTNETNEAKTAMLSPATTHKKESLIANIVDKQIEARTQILNVETSETGQKTAENKSIAVLPFTNVSAEVENEYFCDGLAEEILNTLGKIEDLQVAARTSAFSFKNKNIEVSEIGRVLNVGTILEGSVRRFGNRVRITVQLVNAANGYHLWTEKYDREMKDIFDVQDEITLAIVDALKVKLFGDEKAAVLRRYTDNPQAYELYLKGLFYYNRSSREDWLKAAECFEQAIAIEPEYAPAYAGMGLCYSTLYIFGVLAPDEIIPRWKEATTRALAIDENLAEAHLSAANLNSYYEWNWTEAEREYRRAVELDPNIAADRMNFGMFLASRGRFEEGIGEGKRAAEIDPLSLQGNLVLGWIYMFADRMDEALAQTRRLFELEPNFYGLYWQTGFVRLAQGKYSEAIESLEKASSLGNDQIVLSILGYAYGAAGKRDKALGILQRLLETRKREYITAINIARVYGGLGMADETFEWLEKAVVERNGELVFLDNNSKIGIGKLWGEAFHRDARILDLLRSNRLITEENAHDETTNEPGEAQTAIFLPTITSDEQKPPVSLAQTDEPETNPKSKIQNPKTKWWLFGLLGLIVLASGFFAYRYLTPVNKQIESIAVLPFENASGNADLDYLSDGVSESVIDRLSQLGQLKVIARSSSFRYRGQNLNLQEIAKALGVDAIVIGRVVPRGDSYQIRVELVDVRENKQLWGENFNRKASDVQILQTDISREIAENLLLRLSGTQTQQLASQGTTNPQAYQLRLKGRYYFNKFGLPENFHKSVEYYEQAVAIDPNYALAWAELSESYSFGGGRGLNGDERRSKQEASARKALELDPNLAEAHFALANIKRNSWKWEEAEREYRRAIELNPSLSGPHGAYGGLLSNLGRFDEAIAEIKRRNELDPLSILGNASAGDVYFRARQYDEAIRFYMKMLELDQASPDAHLRLGDVYAAQGKYAEAIAEYQKALSLRADNDAPNIEALLAAVYVKAGMRDKAEEILKKLKAAGKDVQPRIVAILYAALGNHDEAFTQLEKAFAERVGGLRLIAVEPHYDSLRSDPRFADLLRRMNLPPTISN